MRGMIGPEVEARREDRVVFQLAGFAERWTAIRIRIYEIGLAPKQRACEDPSERPVAHPGVHHTASTVEHASLTTLRRAEALQALFSHLRRKPDPTPASSQGTHHRWLHWTDCYPVPSHALLCHARPPPSAATSYCPHWRRTAPRAAA